MEEESEEKYIDVGEKGNIDEEDKLISISPYAIRMIHRRLALACSERLSIDLVYAINAINFIISDKGRDVWKKVFEKEGIDFNKIEEEIDDIKKRVDRVKLFYDPIQNKKFNSRVIDKKISDTQRYFRKYFFKTLPKVHLIENRVWDILFFLINKTNLKFKNIPTPDFREFENEYKAKDLTKKSSSAYQDVAKKEEK